MVSTTAAPATSKQSEQPVRSCSSRDLSRIWVGDDNFRATLEVICRYGLRMTNAGRVSISLLEGGELRVAAHAGAALDSPAGEERLSVPILVDGRMLGSLACSRRAPAFSTEETVCAEVLASQAGFAFRMLRRASELELVYEVTRAINSSLNLDDVIESIYQGINRILPTDNFYIAFYDQANESIRFAIELEDCRRRAPRSRPVAAGLTEYLLRTKRPLLIPNRFEETCEALGIRFCGRPSRCWMGAPMVYRDRAVGVIAVQSYREEDLFDEDHLSVLENLAGQAATALENAGLYQELKTSYQELQNAQQRLLQSEKLAAVGQLISGIAHELNNPLTGVVGWTQFLLNAELPPQARQHLATINEQAQRAAKIVQNLLTFSRQHKPERSLVVVNEVVESTLALRAYELKVNNIQVHRRFSLGAGRINADPHQLQQVLLNLIINAEQAMLGSTRAGEQVRGNLTLQTEPGSEGVVISIKDDGPGMSADVLQRIFDPFFTTKPIGTGTGLGLSISYGIIEEHGGRITAASEPGQGAVFTIFLPQGLAAPVAPVQRVLIVDDEESIRELLGVLLEDPAIAAESASTGEEALEKARAVSYDLIICDLKMPGLSGGRFYDQLQAELGPRVPRFIFMTGDVLGAELQGLLDRARALCILKPFDIEKAKEVIRQALEKR